MTKNPRDDWDEENIPNIQQDMKLPPGFIPQGNPSYVPNSQPGMYAGEQKRQAPKIPQSFSMPDELVAQMTPTNNEPINPLAKFYRVPGLYVSIPSKGSFNQNEIKFEMNGEVAVYPMTAADEILLKNPDALISGIALESLIRSCVPGVSNPRSLPMADIDVLLLAIRQTSYSNAMEFQTECPKCETEHTYTANIRQMLESVTYLKPQYILEIGNGLTIVLKPQTLETQVKISTISFQEAKKMQFLAGDDVPEDDKNIQYNKSVARLTEAKQETTCDCIIKIVTPDCEVYEKQFIMDYLQNCPREVTKKIDDILNEINSTGVSKKKHMKCSNEKCGNEWDSDIVFDPTTFFE